MDSSGCMLSVIVPCFNHGKYLQDAIDSIQKEKVKYPYEVIIVDDGSTDEFTLTKLDDLETQGCIIIHQRNAGPAAARNTAIANAGGKYILPLDADNMITPEYINTGIAILEKGEYQVAYCTPVFFGDMDATSRAFKSQPFDITELLAANYIDNCAIFLKEVWTKNNGYDTSIPYWGHEDWEFWINAYTNGFKFYFIRQKLFRYRIVGTSVAEQFKDEKKLAHNRRYIMQKHQQLYLNQYLKLNYIKQKYKADINRFLFSPFIFLGYKLDLLKSPFKKADANFNKMDVDE